MQTLETLRSNIESAEQMLSVVKTMKALAAIKIREYENAVQALSGYSKSIELGLQIALIGHEPIERSTPLDGQRLGAIVFGSEQGLAGQFNERIARYAVGEFDEFDDDWRHRRIMTIGRRVSGQLIDGGLHITDESELPGALDGIRVAGQDVLLKIDDWRSRHHIERIVLFYNAPTSSASYEPRLRWLLPVDPHWLRELQDRAWESRSLPMYSLERDRLFTGLIRQFLFVTLYRAFAESLASENASRLRSMQSAERNIEERLDDLTANYRHRRQSSITEELLDIAAGFESLTLD